MAAKNDAKEIRIGLFPAEFADQLSPHSVETKLKMKPEKNESFRSSCSDFTRADDHEHSWQPSSSSEMNDSVISALKNRFKPRVTQSPTKSFMKEFERKRQDFKHALHPTEADIDQNWTTKYKRPHNTFETSDITYDEPVTKISKPSIELDRRPTSPFQTYKPHPSYKRRFVEFLEDTDQLESGPESKRSKVNDLNVSIECRAIPLSIEEINRIDDSILISPRHDRSSMIATNKHLSARLRLPIYQKLKQKSINTDDHNISMMVDDDGIVVDNTSAEKLKQFHQNCARKWFTGANSVGSTLLGSGFYLRSILKKSPLKQAETEIPAATVTKSSSTIFPSLVQISKPSSVVLPQISALPSTISIAPAVSTTATTSFVTATSVAPNSNFIFSGAPAIPSSFEFGTSNVASAFPAGNLFAVGTTPNAIKSSALSRRKRR